MQLVEIHDRKWFPKFLRDFVTDDLETILNLVNVYQPVALRLRNALADAGTSRVVDLCSGGGGPWPWLYQAFENTNGPPVHIWLTDKYPNVAAFTRARNASGNRIHFRTDPIDAMKLPAELVGFRTFFSSFHHFSAAEGREILQDAIDHKQGIGIFEAPVDCAPIGSTCSDAVPGSYDSDRGPAACAIGSSVPVETPALDLRDSRHTGGAACGWHPFLSACVFSDRPGTDVRKLEGQR